ncbi:UNVERIFIED_ORG: hypothetical protein J2811_003965 [Burkholderia cepacia]|jgi:hypothetical protein|nr:hypothetical protein [Burkholderia cepacia]MDP9596337.1 hypothetical protein [Burkholderia cepacia]MDP9624509.1 hypothetical protein [Burkholderia cepacia]MDP9670594.1 hypothetical protein [Burkholderia cepacia]MDP9717603.1 hypothetical protein [Burkholderia cepacia]
MTADYARAISFLKHEIAELKSSGAVSPGAGA